MPRTEEDQIAESQREHITTMETTTVKDRMDLMEAVFINKIRRVRDQGLMTVGTLTRKADLEGRQDLSDPISSMPGPSRHQVRGHGNMPTPRILTRMRTGALPCLRDRISWTSLATRQKTSLDVLSVVQFTTRVGWINPHVVIGIFVLTVSSVLKTVKGEARSGRGCLGTATSGSPIGSMNHDTISSRRWPSITVTTAVVGRPLVVLASHNEELRTTYSRFMCVYLEFGA